MTVLSQCFRLHLRLNSPNGLLLRSQGCRSAPENVVPLRDTTIIATTTTKIPFHYNLPQNPTYFHVSTYGAHVGTRNLV
jgi:hypothetical protein